jgi:hypothetical protein
VFFCEICGKLEFVLIGVNSWFLTTYFSVAFVVRNRRAWLVARMSYSGFEDCRGPSGLAMTAFMVGQSRHPANRRSSAFIRGFCFVQIVPSRGKSLVGGRNGVIHRTLRGRCLNPA